MNRIEDFSGIYPALLTPFGTDGRINEKALEALIEWNIKKGVKGFYVGGSTGEAFLLSMEERRRVLEITAACVNRRCKVIAHVGCIGTGDATALARHAEQTGADAISSIPPFYYNFSFDEVKGYYFDLADAVSLPVLIYNFPAFSGVTLDRERAAEFLRDERFLGIKHTSNDFYALERMKRDFPDKPVFNGFDEMFLAGLAMGADGGVGSTYNFMAEKFVRIRSLFLQGSMEEAAQVQREVNDIISALIKVGVMPGEKAVLELLGMEFGSCRPPFKAVTKEERAYLEKTVLPLL